MPTVGERLLALKNYSELSLAQIAGMAGYKGASSVQKFFNKSYAPEVLPKEVALKLSKAFVGKGNPPIRAEELIALTGEADQFAEAFAEVSYYTHLLHDIISLFYTKRSSSSLITEKGLEVPLFVRSDNENGLHFSAPKHLRHKQLVGLYVTVGNMWPRFEEGEVIFYEHRQPVVQGDDVIVTLVDEMEIDGAMIIGRLYLLHEDEIQLDILSPRDRVVIPRSSVISIRRLLTRADMLDPPKSVL